MKGIYGKNDTKLIAKFVRIFLYAKKEKRNVQLGMSISDNATPIRLLHNGACHLQGTARSLGGVLIGYLGIRTFTPHPVNRLLESIGKSLRKSLKTFFKGGCNALLGLVAMAEDSEGLYAGLKALLCAVKNNEVIALQMQNTRGYQVKAWLWLLSIIALLCRHSAIC